ncbi:ATP-binding protein [Candidatus Woesearchaeota archaeon]|nr:ATP-binding protein [Candidatus Woesearchaeota archaeon]
MNKIIVGRLEAQRQKEGDAGTIFLGKHYVKMGQTTSLANPVLLDVARSHVIFVCGKRGSGKSYTLGVLAEGVSDLPQEIKDNVSIILLDTMGVYWTMKYANQKDMLLLDEWGLQSKGLDVQIYTPTGYHNAYKEKGIPTDFGFAIKPSELNGRDWCMTFEVDENDELGVFITRIINQLKKNSKDYNIDDILKATKTDDHTTQKVKDAAINRFDNAKTWGLFDDNATPLRDIARGGQVTVLDLSCYATIAGSWGIKALVVGLISQKLFVERMIARKNEEYEQVHSSTHFFGDAQKTKKQSFPLVWLVIDEAHEFLPKTGKTLATEPLVTILREGRQPGISLVLATQQPGKIHTDVMTQSDTVIAHRITAKPDVEALGMLMQSYMREGLVEQLDNLPRVKGAALIFDDSNEKMYPMRVRPRFTWHGGESPTALTHEKKIFKFEQENQKN